MAHIKIQLWYIAQNVLQKDKIFESEQGFGMSFESLQFTIHTSTQPDDGYFRLVIVTYGKDAREINAALKSLSFDQGICERKGTISYHHIWYQIIKNKTNNNVLIIVCLTMSEALNRLMRDWFIWSRLMLNQIEHNLHLYLENSNVKQDFFLFYSSHGCVHPSTLCIFNRKYVWLFGKYNIHRPSMAPSARQRY